MEFNLQGLIGFSACEAEHILASAAAKAGDDPIAFELFKREGNRRGHSWATAPIWDGDGDFNAWRQEALQTLDWQAVQPPKEGAGLAHSTCTGRTAYAILPDYSIVVARTGAVSNGPFETYSDQVVAAAFRLYPDGTTQTVGLWPDVDKGVHLRKLEERLDALRKANEQAWALCEKEQVGATEAEWLVAQKKAQAVMASYHKASERHLAEVGKAGITDHCLRGLGLKWARGLIVLL